ncbi:MAG: class III signal peptide-containing protein [archaeon]|nr:class III signal peptide-containing protein [archaeon]MDD2477809.1 class III signal peptide-containing protein [Candidatus ainarchaeum sp.]MDD3084679.1 class III signal peptide-containing protein [Candidatus ainarchaeum sp.]MDD4221225.1 class III signal peptide-containing protein [Candidatus ainarchaeum sp.]MDD4662732.1 class III signal peptide-containing protein [Candidatus ainarchaeum sp.]
MISSKAQISLEYLLIALAVISILSILIYQITNLYSKNITAIDNLELKNTHKDLQNTLNLLKLQPKAITTLTINPQTEWNFQTTTQNTLKINNKNKEYIVTSNNIVVLKFKKIKTSATITIEKSNNKIILDYKTLEK